VNKPRIIEFDFDNKSEQEVDFNNDISIPKLGKNFIWVDIDSTKTEKINEYLIKNDINKDLVNNLYDDIEVYRQNDMLFNITTCFLHNNVIQTETVRCLLGYRHLVTVHNGENYIINKLKDGYITDFNKVARGPAFLIFEMCQHALDGYHKVHDDLRHKLMQWDISNKKMKVLVGEASVISMELLNLRNLAHKFRVTLRHLAHRNSLHISENTKPFLLNMVNNIDHITEETVVDRNILSDNIMFQVLLVDHKVNDNMKKLTAIALVSMPINVLTSVYGMNFLYMPEYKAFEIPFWSLFIILTFVSITIIRMLKLW
jgi:magnesium transporter